MTFKRMTPRLLSQNSDLVNPGNLFFNKQGSWEPLPWTGKDLQGSKNS